MLIDNAPAYEIKAAAWCSPKRGETFPNLSEAKRQCSDDAACTKLYDAGGAGNKFVLCGKDAKVKTSKKGAILYIKKSEYLCICRSFAMLETIIKFLRSWNIGIIEL